MPKFVLVYHGGQKPETQEEMDKVMGQWKAWIENMGVDVVDPGNPVGLSKTVFADSVADNGGANPTSGYTLVNATDIVDAVEKAKGCPILGHGGNIEVAEAIEM